MRRGALTAACVVAALVLAGCGEQGVVAPTAEEVVGTIKAEAPGRAIFASQGCDACHIYTPAQATTGTIGPDLDKLADFARTANQPLVEFTRESIVNPSAYIEKGFADVMPKDYDQKLSDQELSDLVDFLTKPQG
jgi:cytochrome c551/c552